MPYRIENASAGDRSTISVGKLGAIGPDEICPAGGGRRGRSLGYLRQPLDESDDERLRNGLTIANRQRPILCAPRIRR